MLVCRRGPHTPPLSLLKAFSGQLLATVRGADTILQGRKGDTEPSRPVNHPVQEDNSPVPPSSSQSHSPRTVWAPRLLQHPQVGQGSAPTLQLPQAIPKHPPLLQFPTTRARGFSKTSLKSLSGTFPPSMSLQVCCQLLSLAQQLCAPEALLAGHCLTQHWLTPQQQHPAHFQSSLTSSSNAFPVQLCWAYSSSIHADTCPGAHTRGSTFLHFPVHVMGTRTVPWSDSRPSLHSMRSLLHIFIYYHPHISAFLYQRFGC